MMTLARSAMAACARSTLALPAAAAAASRLGARSYTNTSVYTRSDTMTSQEHLDALLKEQRYLIQLLKADDSAAPWAQCPKEDAFASRHPQDDFAEPRSWQPEDVFHN